LKRFLVKCGVIPNDNLLLAIIRRMDLDADAKLNFKEFVDGIRPLEAYTLK
jgi:Ca2+-binding EF-hand superfamily protein